MTYLCILMENNVEFIDLGLIDYKEAWDYQESLFKTAVDLKIAKRKGETENIPNHHLIFCEHPPVYTLGKSGSEENLLLNEKISHEDEVTWQ